jgi:hypothetical protein
MKMRNTPKSEEDQPEIRQEKPAEFKNYRVIETAEIHTDRIRLNEVQAAARKIRLQATKEEGVYIPLTNLQFKRGEVIGLADIEKSQKSKLELCD